MTSKDDLNLVSGLTRLGNKEGESWVTLTEAEAEAIRTELSRLHAEHLQDIDRMERAAETIKRLSAPETPATSEPVGYGVFLYNGRLLEVVHTEGDRAYQASLGGREVKPLYIHPPTPEKANEEPADEIRVWECASCKHWTPVSHARCACCGRERAVKTSQSQALDELVKASEEIGGYDLPATPRDPSLPTDFNGDPIKPKAL